MRLPLDSLIGIDCAAGAEGVGAWDGGGVAGAVVCGGTAAAAREASVEAGAAQAAQAQINAIAPAHHGPLDIAQS